VKLVVCREHTVLGSLRALEGEIAVQFDHGMARLYCVVAVDLNFVVVLRADRKRNNTEGTENTESVEISRIENRLKRPRE
jgi:hypothetical protein